MSRQGRLPGDRAYIDCVPPLVVDISTERGVRRRTWDALMHTCDFKIQIEDACLACGYRDCPTKDPSHYRSDGCPSCKEL
jgi:hypothetical protein